jgi:3',5'-cyclic-nucleotide phosphodiesterase
LENYHIAKGYEIMQDHNIMENMTAEQSKSMRSTIISMVLATDMISHFESISKFKNLMASDSTDRTCFLN